jgi:hypothetical protein
VHASAYEDYLFSYWTKNGIQVTTNPNYAVTNAVASATYVMTAYFTANPPTPPDTPSTPGAGYYRVNVEASNGGSVSISGLQTLESPNAYGEGGETLTVTATPDPNWRFIYWYYDSANVSVSRTVTVGPEASDTAHTLKAIFQAVEPPPPNQFIPPASASVGVVSASPLFKQITKKTKKQKPVDIGKIFRKLKL